MQKRFEISWRRWLCVVLMAAVCGGCAMTGDEQEENAWRRNQSSNSRPSSTIGDFLSQPRPE